MEDKIRCCIAQTVAYFFSSRERSAILLFLHESIWGLPFLGVGGRLTSLI